jgi:hypothetical protein
VFRESQDVRIVVTGNEDPGPVDKVEEGAEVLEGQITRRDHEVDPERRGPSRSQVGDLLVTDCQRSDHSGHATCVHGGRATSCVRAYGLARRDAASVIFSLPGFRVADAVDLPLGGRRVNVQLLILLTAARSVGVVSSRVHPWVEQRVSESSVNSAAFSLVSGLGSDTRSPDFKCPER